MSEDLSKSKRPFFSPFVKEFLELILEAEAKPSKGLGSEFPSHICVMGSPPPVTHVMQVRTAEI